MSDQSTADRPTDTITSGTARDCGPNDIVEDHRVSDVLTESLDVFCKPKDTVD